jgi:hypothetical protein
MNFVNKSFMSVVQSENVLKDYQIEWQKIQALRRVSVTLRIECGFFAIACPFSDEVYAT